MSLVNSFDSLGLDGTLQKIAVSLASIANNLGRVYPDNNGNLHVNVQSGTLPTVTTVAAINSLTATAGYNMAYDQYAQMQINANSVRNQIATS